MPEAAYLACIPPAIGPSTIGVSGGGGEPLAAFVVETEETDVKRLTPPGLGMRRPSSGMELDGAGYWYCETGAGAADAE